MYTTDLTRFIVFSLSVASLLHVFLFLLSIFLFFSFPVSVVLCSVRVVIINLYKRQVHRRWQNKNHSFIPQSKQNKSSYYISNYFESTNLIPQSILYPWTYEIGTIRSLEWCPNDTLLL